MNSVYIIFKEMQGGENSMLNVYSEFHKALLMFLQMLDIDKVEVQIVKDVINQLMTDFEDHKSIKVGHYTLVRRIVY